MFVNRRGNLYAQALMRPLHHYKHFLLTGHLKLSSRSNGLDEWAGQPFERMLKSLQVIEDPFSF